MPQDGGGNHGQVGAYPAGYGDPNFTPSLFPDEHVEIMDDAGWSAAGDNVPAATSRVATRRAPLPTAGFTDRACRRHYAHDAAVSVQSVAQNNAQPQPRTAAGMVGGASRKFTVQDGAHIT